MRNPFVYAFAALSVLLVSMGGRIIVLSAMLMLLTFYSVYVRRLRVKQTVLTVMVLVACSHLIMLSRDGHWKKFGWQMLALAGEGDLWTFVSLPVSDFFRYFLSENFNVSLSLLDFLTTYTVPLLRAPITLVTGLVSLVPSIVFPAKSSYILDFPKLGWPVDSPAGGMHVFVSLIIGFGILGSMVFLFLLGAAMRSFRQAPGAMYAAMYIMMSGWLGMMFFRDLQQVVIKEMLQFSILVPLVISAVGGFSRKKTNGHSLAD